MGMIFKDTSKAFQPFFDTTIAIQGIRKDNCQVNTSILASLFPVEDIDPLSDGDVETEVKKISAIVDKIYFGKIQVGDTLTTEDNEVFKVSKVEKSLDCTKIEARSI